MDKHVHALIELARAYGYQVTFRFNGGPPESGPQWRCTVYMGVEAIDVPGITINDSALSALEEMPESIVKEFLQ